MDLVFPLALGVVGILVGINLHVRAARPYDFERDGR